MKITKLGHACLVLEKEGSVLVIDPGSFTEPPEGLRADILVVTEEHLDHYSPENIRKLIEVNPELRIICNSSVGEQLINEAIAAESMTQDSILEASGFTLEFTHKDHAPVYEKSPCRVMTVRVDDLLYYAADSYETPETPVDILAVPTSGPWFKLSEAIDFVKQVDCQRILFTHNYLNSTAGNSISNKYIVANTNIDDENALALEEGESIEI